MISEVKEITRYKVKYETGQWFAVPLQDGGYVLGILVRGTLKTRGGLGYFFGKRYENIPSGEETYLYYKDNSILICIFGDLGIIRGEWPLIKNAKPFVAEEWPVPLFYREAFLMGENKVFLVQYGQNFSGLEMPQQEILTDFSEEIKKLPRDGVFGSLALEIYLTKLLKENQERKNDSYSDK